MGENVASCLAGVVSYRGLSRLDDPARTALREDADRRHDRGLAAGRGSVALPRTGAAIWPRPMRRALSVASGGVAEVDALEKRLEEAEIDFQRVQIDRAAHSRLLDPILAEFRRFIQGLDLRPPKIPFLSESHGAADHRRAGHGSRILGPAPSRGRPASRRASRRFWRRRVGSCSRSVRARRCVPSRDSSRRQAASANIIPSIRHRSRPAVETALFFLTSLGRLWASGAEIDLTTLYEGETRRRVRLPTYAWDHQSYFIERVESRDRRQSDAGLP